MKKILFASIISTFILVLSGCAQIGAKNFGGSYEIDLPQGEKLINITFKDTDIWYLTRPMREDEKAETYKFKEDSTYGVMEGVITIKESE